MPRRFFSPTKKNKGFTLLEVLIATFILIVGAGATFYSIGQISRLISFTKERFIASYLAQEGVEIVKNIRDSNWLAGRNWNEGLNPGSWQVDYNDPNLSPFFGNLLNIETSDFYGYGSGWPTKFVRRININSAGANRLMVEVIVSWQERGRTHNFTLKSIITNWLTP